MRRVNFDRGVDWRKLAIRRASLSYHAKLRAEYMMRQAETFIDDPCEDIRDHAAMLIMRYMAEAMYYEKARRQAAEELSYGN